MSILCTGVMKIGELAAVSNACNCGYERKCNPEKYILAKRQTRQRGKLSTKAN